MLHVKVISVCLLIHLSSPSNAQTVKSWVTTTDQKNLLTPKSDQMWNAKPTSKHHVKVDESILFQEMDGFGTSLTDASAWLIQNTMEPDKRSFLFRKLFHPTEGIGLNFLRQPIGASDMCFRRYDFDSTCCDDAGFSIDHDRAYIIPQLKEIMEINPDVKILGTPWSPPGWMKTSGNMVGGSLLPEYYEAEAQYFVDFIKEYEEAGIPIWGVTTQNEPEYVPYNYPGMFVSPANQTKFIKHHLGPAFKRHNIKAKILVWDHNWDMPQYPIEVMSDPEVYDYVAGTAWHCYLGVYKTQEVVQQKFPEKGMWLTECSDLNWINDGTFEGLFRRGMSDLTIGSVRYGAKSVVKWNVALDQNLGPHTGGCDACIGTVEIQNPTGAITYNAEYYQLGHASKFLRKGARRVDSQTVSGNIESVAFLNTDGEIVLIAYNPDNTPAQFDIKWNKMYIGYSLEGYSAVTFTWTP